MAKAVGERLDALTRAHEFTRPGLIDAGLKINRDTTLHALVRTIFCPYVDPERSKDRDCVIVNGPDVPIDGNAVTSFALILHEFATNAVKYGALASPAGCVQIDGVEEKDEFLLTWKEHGGPPVIRQPEAEGFGSLLANRIVKGQFGGQISRDWNPEGLVIYLSVPLEHLKK
jgi:two-component sensor histidine kinase